MPTSHTKERQQEAQQPATPQVATAGQQNQPPGISVDAEAFTRLQKLLDQKAKDLEDKFDKKLSDREVRVMEVLSIFVVVLTFVSTNISIFSKVTSLMQAVLFMLAMTLCSVFIMAFLFALINKWNLKKIPLAWIGILIPILIVAGISILLAFHPVLNLPLDSLGSDSSIQQPMTTTNTTSSAISVPRR
jgi:hypothetical protein